MRGFTGVAGHQALSAGTLLIAAGGLALYQMTSLVLGPAGSRELHLSLTVPAVEPDERNESWASGPNLTLGTLAPPSPPASARVASILTHRASVTHPGVPPLPPVTQPPTSQPSALPLPPVVSVQDPKPGAHKGDDTKRGAHKDDDPKPNAHRDHDTD